MQITCRGAFYIRVLGTSGSQITVKSLRQDTPLPIATPRKAEMPGAPHSLDWKWTPDGLQIKIPETRPSDEAVVIKLT